MSNALDYSAADYVGTQIHTAQVPHGRHLQLEADVVIVGTGPGGLTAAHVLAESGARVVMLEAGSFWPKGSFHRSQARALRDLVQDRGTRVMLGNTHVPLMSGRGVGGGTLINSAISFRAPDGVLDEWMARGLDYWADREALYAEVEEAIGVTVTPEAIAGNNSHVVRRGLARMPGVTHGFMPRSAPGCAGCGTCQTGCPSGGKASADLNWLPRALRAGAHVYANTEVEEILCRGARAVGLRGAMRDPQSGDLVASVEVRADRVVLAAGAVNTPLLLLRNGLANSSGLVGRNLHVQPGTAVVAEFDEEIRIWNGATQGYYAFHPEDPEVLVESFSASAETFFAAVGEPGAAAHRLLRRLKHFAGAGSLIRDASTGVIRPVDDGGPPSIRYDLIETDREKLVRGTQFVSTMFFNAGARLVRPLLGGARWFEERNACVNFIEGVRNPADFVLYASHPMGTCQLGEDPRRSVVRPQDGRTHDHEGLYVLDASLHPTALGVNPQMTIMAQCLALARRIVAGNA